MSDILFNDWRAENAQINYPFDDTATLSNGTLTLQTSLFIDGRLYPINGDETLYMNRITRSGNDIVFAIATTAAGELATTTYDVTAIPISGELAFYDSYSRSAGMLLSTSEALQAFSGLNAGTHTFLQTQTHFAPAVIVPQPAVGVRGFITESGELLSGDMWFVGENGVVLRNDDTALRIDVIGDPFASRKLCSDEESSDETVALLTAYCPIRTINGITPDEVGNIQLLIGSNQSLTNLMRIEPGIQPSSDVAKHVGGAGALKFATLVIKVLGQRRLRGDIS